LGCGAGCVRAGLRRCCAACPGRSTLPRPRPHLPLVIYQRPAPSSRPGPLARRGGRVGGGGGGGGRSCGGPGGPSWDGTSGRGSALLLVAADEVDGEVARCHRGPTKRGAKQTVSAWVRDGGWMKANFQACTALYIARLPRLGCLPRKLPRRERNDAPWFVNEMRAGTHRRPRALARCRPS
jgi:hypothetical protein